MYGWVGFLEVGSERARSVFGAGEEVNFVLKGLPGGQARVAIDGIDNALRRLILNFGRRV